MSGRARGSWLRLMGVAVLMVGAMLLVGFMVLMTLNALTWTLWDPSGDPPLWLDVLAMTVIVVLAAVPGAVVGLAAGLRRWWVRVAMAMSALVGVGAGALMLLLSAQDATPVVAAAGSVVGSLVAVALADRLGGDDPVPGDAAAGRPMRSREERVIAGVCGGWARAHGWEPVRVRLLVVVVGVVLAVALPPLTLAVVGYYVFAWLSWPREPVPTPTAPSEMVCAGRGGSPDDRHRQERQSPCRERGEDDAVGSRGRGAGVGVVDGAGGLGSGARLRRERWFGR